MAGPVPSDDAGWAALCRSAQAPCWSMLAEGSGGRTWTRDGVTAAIVPAAPERSVFNSVFCDDPAAMLGSFEEIAGLYDEAGVNGWAVWIPEEDAATASALKAAGHVLDSDPALMGLDLARLHEPELDPELEVFERADYVEMARINEIAYGYPPGEYRAVAEAVMPGARLWFASLAGEEVCTLATWPNRGTDAHVMWVATLPEARNRGIAGRLLAHALRAARDEDGLVTGSLESSKLGQAVYERLGFTQCGAMQMWERRRPAGGDAA